MENVKIYTGPEDVYKELVEDSDESWLLGLLAFAVVEEQKIEWMKHIENTKGEPPGHEEIQNWYQQQNPNVLLRAKGTAENTLQLYSQEVTDLAFEEERHQIEESIIVGEIRELKKFWPQFGVNLAGGFVASLLFAVLLIIFAFLVIYDVSPVEIGEELRGKVEETGNGEEIRSHE